MQPLHETPKIAVIFTTIRVVDAHRIGCEHDTSTSDSNVKTREKNGTVEQGNNHALRHSRTCRSITFAWNPAAMMPVGMANRATAKTATNVPITMPTAEYSFISGNSPKRLTIAKKEAL
jgi:hypothetical protein